MKAGFDARARARREKEKEREEKEAEEKREEEERENNFDEWATRLRREQEVWQSLAACLDVLAESFDLR
jgi:actin-related protein 5